ncbi:unnamed protein product [Notodromas monacha]|uniref:Uncharacterized protein n=1 Tax=Notodromas monacha TaxID=399045 RepID=A0A7R9GLM3_9CRUS|nr:unnamed protein product [Notodromas monacha]CAG0925126.1 unnamed protein product [Notodromas monacha]
MAAFCYPYSLPNIKKNLSEECKRSGEMTFWFLRSLYCDAMETVSGNRANLLDASLPFEEASAVEITTMQQMDAGREAPMSSLVTMLPPPPSITSTGGWHNNIKE